MRSTLLLAAAVLSLAACAPNVTLTTTADARTTQAPATMAATSGPPAYPVAGTTARADGPASSPADPSAVSRPAPVGSFVLGDSISLGVGPRLARLGYPVVGRVGQAVNDGFLRTHLGSSAAQSAPAWVVLLGTNNPGDDADVDRLDDWLDLVEDLRADPDPQDVYWVTPYRDPRYLGGLSAWALDDFNAELVEQARDRSWLHVVDYATVAALHPEWFEADGSHLHPDEAGYGVLAAMIAGPDAVPLLTPAPLQTLDAPGSFDTGQDTPAHPTGRPTPSADRPASDPPATPSAAEPPAPEPPTEAPTQAEEAEPDADPAPEFSPAS